MRFFARKQNKTTNKSVLENKGDAGRKCCGREADALAVTRFNTSAVLFGFGVLSVNGRFALIIQSFEVLPRLFHLALKALDLL